MVLETFFRAIGQIANAVDVIRSLIGADESNNLAKRTRENFREDRIRFRTPGDGEDEEVEGNALKSDIQEGVSDLVGEFPEEATELIVEQAPPEEIDDDEDIREVVQGIQGAALTEALLAVSGSLGIEVAGLTQVESHQFIVSQILAAGGIDSVLGQEAEATISEGVRPRLDQQINAEYRSKQVDIQDVIEQALRNKDSDEDFIDDVSTYGVKPEQVSILEEVAISEVQPEELIETPAEAGVLPDEETLEAELDRTGISEDAKDVFRETVEQLPRTTRLVQEQLTLDELLRVLDTRVQNGTLSVDDAMAALPEDADESREALRERFELLATNARDELSEADKLGHYSLGITTLDTAGDELATPGREDSEVGRLLVEETLSEIDGDMRQALGLGLIDDSEYTSRASIAGLDQDVVNRLLDGEDLDEIANSRLVSSDTEAGQSVESIIGIGSARGSALASAGVETVTDLANADPEEVSDIAQVSVDVAQDFVAAAVRRTQNQS